MTLSNRQDYLDGDKPINIAYRTLIKEFAQTLTNETNNIDSEVGFLYEFERRLAQVKTLLIIDL